MGLVLKVIFVKPLLWKFIWEEGVHFVIGFKYRMLEDLFKSRILIKMK
jgi:hypothetical protein